MFNRLYLSLHWFPSRNQLFLSPNNIDRGERDFSGIYFNTRTRSFERNGDSENKSLGLVRFPPRIRIQ